MNKKAKPRANIPKNAKPKGDSSILSAEEKKELVALMKKESYKQNRYRQPPRYSELWQYN